MNPRTESKNQSWKVRRLHTVAVTAAVLMLLPLAPLGGGVVTECTDANLRAAMAGGGMVTFTCDGTIMLSDTITISLDTLLDGSGNQVTISGGNTMRVFYVNTNVSFTLANLTVANGYSSNGAGIFNNGGTIALLGTTLQFNTARGGSDAFGQRHTGEGGAIYSEAGSVSATNCLFADNIASQPVFYFPDFESQASGGAIWSRSVLNLRKCVFADNQAEGDSAPGSGMETFPGQGGAGGAIYTIGVATVSECAFIGNSARGGNGGYSVINNGLGQNGGKGQGGAIVNIGTLNTHDSDFVGNGSFGGNGGYGAGSLPSPGYPSWGYSGGGGGLAHGGAILNQGNATVSGSTFQSNRCAGGRGGSGGYPGAAPLGYPGAPGGSGGGGGSGLGGALFNGGTLVLINDSLCGNTTTGNAGGQGGAGGSSATHTLPGGAGGSGGGGGSGCGGIWDISGGSLSITNCTVAFNSGTGGAGALGGQGGSGGYGGSPGSPGNPGQDGSACGGINTFQGQLINTLLATNDPGGNGVGTINDAGHNLSSDGTCVFTNVGSLNNTDPKLGPLTNNGGPTLTMALLPGSPAIDAGDSAAAPSTDQRGFSRPYGAAAEIGAYEYALFMTINRAQGNTLNLQVRDGYVGQLCRLLTGTTFSNWQSVATNPIGADGTTLFLQNCNVGECQRFYRAVSP